MTRSETSPDDGCPVHMPSIPGWAGPARLSRWNVEPGARVALGDVIAEVAADGITLEVEAECDGLVAAMLHDPGPDPVDAGTVIAVISTNDAGADGAGNEAGSPGDVAGAGAGSSNTAARDELESPSALSTDDIDTPRRKIAIGAALREALTEEMERDTRVVLFGEDIADDTNPAKVTHGLLGKFGERRVRNVPVTESGFTGLAIGAALAGLRPVVEYQHFSYALQAIGQIVTTAAKMRYLSAGRLNVPIVLRGPNGAGARTGAQFSQNFANWFASVPGLVVLSPAHAADAKGLLKQAIRSDDPVLLLEAEGLYGSVGAVPDVADHLCPFGSAFVVRPGETVTLVGYGATVSICLRAAKRLLSEGIDAEVIDLRSLRPLDTDTVFRSVGKTNRVVTVEHAWPGCGIGSELVSRIVASCFDDLDAPPTRVTGADVPMPYAANLERLALPSAGDVVRAVKKVCYQ